MALRARERPRHRTHTWGGCATCRKRHARCDRVRPECLTCRADGWKCAGYPVNLKWVNSGQDADNAGPGAKNVQSARAHLYCETTRASMSQSLRSDFSSRSVDETLTELDARTKGHDSLATQGMAVGPFGVFGLAQQRQNSHTAQQQPGGTMSGSVVAVDPLEAADAAPSLLDGFDLSKDVPDLLNWQDLFNMDVMYTEDLLQTSDTQFLPFASAEEPVDHALAEHQTGMVNSTALGRDAVAAPLQLLPVTAMATLPGTVRPIDDIVSTSDAQLLLRHLRDHVIPQMGPMPNDKKSPFEILHLDFAIITLAMTTFMGCQTVTNAALTNLYALLALAATHLSAQPNQSPTKSAQDWQSFASTAIQRARSHLMLSHQHETYGLLAAKYKHQVMAISSMLAYSVFTNESESERAYMIDAERLLRQRGLIKRSISRRARLLHHVYTWTRIIHESMYVLHDVKHREPQRNLTEYGPQEECCSNGSRSGNYSRLDDFLRLDQDYAGIERERTTEVEKDHENGLRDIHLEDSREFEGFYLQHYGVSEAWLSLLSQTTRLVNVIDRFEAGKKDMKGICWGSVKIRKQRLESKICALASKNWQSDRRDSVDRDRSDAQSSMVRALNTGLAIFYYRRASDVNAWILQDRVCEVMDALKHFETACKAQSFPGPGSPWPAFIAGCEALRPDQREFFEGWFDRAIALTGMPRLIAAKSCMLDVWQRSHQTSQADGVKLGDQASWVRVCKEQNLHLLLS